MAGVSINHIGISGNLTRDLESRAAGDGIVVNMGLAGNERKKGLDGKYGDSPIWLDVTIFGKTAENCLANLKKGDNVYVEGRLTMDFWEKDGKKNSKLKIIASDVKFLKWGKDRAPQGDETPQGDSSKAPF